VLSFKAVALFHIIETMSIKSVMPVTGLVTSVLPPPHENPYREVSSFRLIQNGCMVIISWNKLPYRVRFI